MCRMIVWCYLGFNRDNFHYIWDERKFSSGIPIVDKPAMRQIKLANIYVNEDSLLDKAIDNIHLHYF